MVCSDPSVRDWMDQRAWNSRCKAIRNVRRLLLVGFSVSTYCTYWSYYGQEHASGQRSAERMLQASRTIFLSRQVSESYIAAVYKSPLVMSHRPSRRLIYLSENTRHGADDESGVDICARYTNHKHAKQAIVFFSIYMKRTRVRAWVCSHYFYIFHLWTRSTVQV